MNPRPAGGGSRYVLLFAHRSGLPATPLAPWSTGGRDCGRFQVPQGRPTIAQRFIAGFLCDPRSRVPSGTTEAAPSLASVDSDPGVMPRRVVCRPSGAQEDSPAAFPSDESLGYSLSPCRARAVDLRRRWCRGSGWPIPSAHRAAPRRADRPVAEAVNQGHAPIYGTPYSVGKEEAPSTPPLWQRPMFRRPFTAQVQGKDRRDGLTPKRLRRRAGLQPPFSR